jgi:hypothetical protein
MWPDDAGNFMSDWATGDAYVEPRTSDTAAPDLATASQGVDNSGTGSAWGGFGNLVNQVVGAGLGVWTARQNAELQQQRAQAAQTQPVIGWSAATGTTGGSLRVSPMLLLLGAVGLAVVFAGKAKG